MKQINEKDEQVIAKYKLLINELSVVQHAYLHDLTKELELEEQYGRFLFDYIYNFSPEEYPSFADYMAQFNRQLNYEQQTAK